MVSVWLSPAIARDYDTRDYLGCAEFATETLPKAWRYSVVEVSERVAREMLDDALWYADKRTGPDISPGLRQAYDFHANRLRKVLGR